MLSYRHHYNKYYFFFVALLLSLVGSIAATGQNEYPFEEFPFFDQCDYHTEPIECPLPVSAEMACNGVFMCCPENPNELRNYICDGEKFVNAERSQKRIEDMNIADLAFTIDDLPFGRNDSASVALVPSATGVAFASTATVFLSSFLL